MTWVLACRPHYTAATTVAPEMVYGWVLLRNSLPSGSDRWGRNLAFVPYRTEATDE